MQQIIISIDPGREKCGLAAVDLQGNALQLELVLRKNLQTTLLVLIDKWRNQGAEITLIMGNGTDHKQVLKELSALNADMRIQLVGEYGTTLAARDLYWQYNKARWWECIIPSSWRSTPPLDAYAAWAIARNHISRLL